MVHTLARDPVGHVRYQIIERINFLFRSEPEWVWAELEHVIGADPSESVICGALAALSHIAQEDRDRAVGLANDVLSRFNAPGVVDLGRCREFATTFIFDAYVWTEHSAARDFALALVTDIRNQSGYIKLFIARYSGELLAGNTLDAGDTKHGVRAKVTQALPRCPRWSCRDDDGAIDRERPDGVFVVAGRPAGRVPGHGERTRRDRLAVSLVSRWRP